MKIESHGRICLVGEHCDWPTEYKKKNKFIIPGKSLIMQTELGLYADVQKSKHLIIKNSDETFKIETNLQDLYIHAKSNQFYSYCSACAYLINKKYNLGGLKVDIYKSNLPCKKSFASSAAICYLVVHAYNLIYNLWLSLDDEMELAYRAERLIGVKCGVMDFYSNYPGRIKCIDYASKTLNTVHPKKDLFFVHADLNGHKVTHKILNSLHSIYPYARNLHQFNAHVFLGLYSRYICDKTIKAIEDGNPKMVGKCMNKTQKYFDKYISRFCKSELSSPLLHEIMSNKLIVSKSYGIKGHGSQGDGSVQVLARNKEDQEDIVKELESMGYKTFVNNYQSEVIDTAIIALCGKGSRLKPYTNLVSKEFCPVVDNGKLKPLIEVLLDYIYNMGIKHVYIAVSSSKQKKMYKDYLYKNSNDQSRKNRTIYNSIKFLVVKDSLGFGDTVLRFKKYCLNKPVMLFLGDTLYPQELCEYVYSEANRLYKKFKKPIIFLSPKSNDNVENCGICSGKYILKNVIKIEKMIEKPSLELCKNEYQIDEKNYGVYGIYVLTDEIFDMLEYDKHTRNENGEFQLTETLINYLKNGSIYGVLMENDSYDYGNVVDYSRNFERKNQS